jgi:hypothetical protein
MERRVPQSGGSTRVDGESVRSRHQLREREKRELRHERDRLLVELAQSLGSDGVARAFGTNAATADTLVQRARGRLVGSNGEISARRVPSDPERWSEADRHYEALGRSVRLPDGPRRRA